MIIGSIATGIAAVIPLIGMILSPVGLVILAITALTAAFFLFRDEIDLAVNKAKEVVGTALEGIRTFFSELPDKIGSHLSEAFSKISNWGLEMVSKAASIGLEVVKNIINVISTLPGKVFEWLTAVFRKMKDTYSSARDAAKGFGQAILDSVVDIVKGLPGRVWDFMTSAIDKVRQGITRIKDRITDFFSGSGGGAVTIKVPAYATGGIVEKPTIALVGESGPEAIVPLDKINKLDTKSESSMDDRPINIVLQVGSTELGRVVIDSINKLSRQEGRLLLNL
jgi:phage-related protein